jgi:SAM-dependent methyltransferase
MTRNYFGEDVAARYDDPDDEMSQAGAIAPVVEFIARLAGDGAALELGIGTGRIALPLAERGVRVAGIDSSEAMVARLRAKPGGGDLEVAIGDFASTRVGGEFALVYLIFNTISNLVTQDAQVACFENASAHLQPGGRFVIETRVPELQKLPLGQTIVNARSEPQRISNYVYDVVTQGLQAQHYYFRDDGTVDASPVPMRYAWPAELDLMARLAGMRLEHRWGGWLGEPFTARSSSHVSVYVKT